MDVILQCYFENFEKLERNALHARYKRRAMVEYFNTLIEGCRRGQNCDAAKPVREAVTGILRYHEKSKMDNCSVCMMGKFHNVLYIALKLCYDWKLQETGIVAALLDEIFHCEHTFERLLIGALFGTRAPHFLAGWKSDFASQEENVRAMIYFLNHATDACSDYCYNGRLIRFIDVPIESCGKSTCVKILVQLGVPDKLHMLLRYGAQIYSDDDDKNENVVEILLIRLSEFKGAYPYNIVSCLQLVLRVLPSIQLGNDGIVDRFPYLVRDCILPADRCGLRPALLKHLCRCAVRHRLWLNYQLPNGIRDLPVPNSLQRYIDIMED